MTGALTGTRTMVRLALRRDRIVLPIWILVLGLVPAGTAGAYDELYATPADRAALVAGGQNPAVAVLYGKAFDLGTAGGFTAWRYGAFLPVFIALMCVFTVMRHTRAEEETGRLELLGAGVLGRYAALAAGIAVSAGAAVAVGVLEVLGMVGSGLPVAGSLVLAGGVTATGLAFTGVAAVTAQVFTYARTANGVACGVLGLAFLLRAVGDSTAELSWLSWLSPVGWSQRAQAFAGDRWWAPLLGLALAAALTAVALRLQPRRDVGAGLVAPRPGPATGAAGLRGPLALAWRLHRGQLVGWTVALAVIGGVFGSIAVGIGDLVGRNPKTLEIFQRMGGTQNLIDSYLAAICGVFGLVVAVYAVQAGLRARAEESTGLLEPVLATAAGRTRWLTSHLVFAVLGPVLLLAVAGAAAGLTYGLRVGAVGTQVPHVLGATVAQAPAVLVVAALAALLFGLAPRYSQASWAVLVVCLLITLFGPVLKLGQAVLDVSPFGHVPKLPSAPFTATPLLWLTGIAVLLLAAALVSFRRRDLG